MKFLQHRRDVLGRVDTNIHAGGKSALASAEDDRRNLAVLIQRLQRFEQLIHHLEVNHIERRMVKRNAGKLAGRFDAKTLCGSSSRHNK